MPTAGSTTKRASPLPQAVSEAAGVAPTYGMVVLGCLETDARRYHPGHWPGVAPVVPVEMLGNKVRKAPGPGVIVNAYRMPRKKLAARQLVPMMKKK